MAILEQTLSVSTLSHDQNLAFSRIAPTLTSQNITKILRKIKQPSHNEMCDVTINIGSDVPLQINSVQEFIHDLLLIFFDHSLIIAQQNNPSI
jgi:hypothetical protein